MLINNCYQYNVYWIWLLIPFSDGLFLARIQSLTKFLAFTWIWPLQNFLLAYRLLLSLFNSLLHFLHAYSFLLSFLLEYSLFLSFLLAYILLLSLFIFIIIISCIQPFAEFFTEFFSILTLKESMHVMEQNGRQGCITVGTVNCDWPAMHP
jgi:hypothetical protein